jgi:hypothetical protein
VRASGFQALEITESYTKIEKIFANNKAVSDHNRRPEQGYRPAPETFRSAL